VRPRNERRRVAIVWAIPTSMMAMDGTWQRGCTLKGVSDSRAKLLIEGSVEGLPLKEFFPVLSSTVSDVLRPRASVLG
jgi:hypothetical protein